MEKILPPDAAAATTALCLDGARACPPEDCGGVWGYDNLLKILKNRKHPEHKTMRYGWAARSTPQPSTWGKPTFGCEN